MVNTSQRLNAVKRKLLFTLDRCEYIHFDFNCCRPVHLVVVAALLFSKLPIAKLLLADHQNQPSEQEQDS
jgi:hypothetical protein